MLELPGLVHDIAEGTRLYEALVKANVLRGYADFHVIGSFSTPIYHIWSRKQIRSISDLKGMKVRIAGPSIGQTVKELGMVPIMMPPNEVVEAIGRGTVDAATLAACRRWSISASRRVTTYDYLLPLGSGPLAVMMNKAKYEALPPAGQGGDHQVLAEVHERLLHQERHRLQREHRRQIQNRTQAQGRHTRRRPISPP